MTDVKPVQMYQQPGAAFAQQAGGQVVQVIGQGTCELAKEVV